MKWFFSLLAVTIHLCYSATVIAVLMTSKGRRVTFWCVTLLLMLKHSFSSDPEANAPAFDKQAGSGVRERAAKGFRERAAK